MTIRIITTAFLSGVVPIAATNGRDFLVNKGEPVNLLEQHALDLMQKDPLDMAEKALGAGADATGLAVMLTQKFASQKEDALSILGDTYFGIEPNYCAMLLVRAGYKELYSETHGELHDVFQIWGHADGLLLVTDTCDQRCMNTIQVYYNWIPTEKAAAYAMRSSGGFTERGVWSGHYDGREGLFTHLKFLRQHGQLLAQWQDIPFLWLLNYTETRECGYGMPGIAFSDAVNKRKIALLPAASRAAMGYKE